MFNGCLSLGFEYMQLMQFPFRFANVVKAFSRFLLSFLIVCWLEAAHDCRISQDYPEPPLPSFYTIRTVQSVSYILPPVYEVFILHEVALFIRLVVSTLHTMDEEKEEILDITTVTTRYQITLTKPVRKFLEVELGDRIIFIRKGNEVIIRKA